MANERFFAMMEENILTALIAVESVKIYYSHILFVQVNLFAKKKSIKSY